MVKKRLTKTKRSINGHSEPILNAIVNVIKTFTKRLCVRWGITALADDTAHRRRLRDAVIEHGPTVAQTVTSRQDIIIIIIINRHFKSHK